MKLSSGLGPRAYGLTKKTILLIVTGSIAAYKAPELIRLLVKDGARVIPVLTKGGAQFVTPLTLQTLAEEKSYSDLFSLTDEAEMGHIKLSRIADLVVIAPASADFIAKMAYGLGDDLASTLLLANKKPVLCAPAMNPQMWAASATQDNIKSLTKRGVNWVGPVSGDVACHEDGVGRMAEPTDIFAAIKSHFTASSILKNKKVIITAGPTVEAIDPVRFMSNHSSGKQGFAIAQALALAGADVTLIHGPVCLNPSPRIKKTIAVTSALEMQKAVEAALPADIAICAAAVADWRVKQTQDNKIKKAATPPTLTMQENPDILLSLATHKKRPKLVIGFAAETEKLEKHAAAKLTRKKCDWLLANDVAKHAFGADHNQILFLQKGKKPVSWKEMSKQDVAEKLVQAITTFFK
ncbi:MAG: bifunctional phosphopantothenoylcysteine decarboxylase/phosphopantothenate--cysteine ligase CoaBC [Alphaproteobacteria bacterium]|nr:bifunctional phosphopantothenoylcysteine decarboxylase/phosphopantothenate--cysteine ligase CoaBC [Alphaproteobacteria bacterium]